MGTKMPQRNFYQEGLFLFDVDFWNRYFAEHCADTVQHDVPTQILEKRQWNLWAYQKAEDQGLCHEKFANEEHMQMFLVNNGKYIVILLKILQNYSSNRFFEKFKNYVFLEQNMFEFCAIIAYGFMSLGNE